MSGGIAIVASYANGTSFASDGTQQTGTRVVAPSATINTKGAWVSLGTLTTDCSALLLRLSYLNNNASDTGASWDIGTGASGSQIVLISNINQAQPGGTPVAALNTFQHILPIPLKAGTQIWARNANNVASSTATMGASFVAFDNAFGLGQEFCAVDTIGWTAVGKGTAMTGGNGTKGTYVQIGTSLNHYRGFFLCFDYSTSTAGVSFLLDIAITGSQFIILPNLRGALELGFSPMDTEYFPIEIPAGVAIYGRTCNLDGSTAPIGVTLYGVY
jgi:hypothetical protein